MKQRIMLYFGSFNPIHNGHTALAEYVVRKDLCDRCVLIVSPQSPFKPSDRLAPDLDRFEMAEIACRCSAEPERIVPSAVEFLLDKPSYTIDTLRYLQDNNGREMAFSLLLGADQIGEFHRWKEPEAILNDYTVHIYPRRGADLSRMDGRMKLLEDAPLWDFSSTEIRRALGLGDDTSAMLCPEVAGYIRRKGLWSAESYRDDLTRLIESRPDDPEPLVERGRWHYRRNAWGKALNDFNAALRLAPDHTQALQYVEMTQEILRYRYTDLYNP